MTDRSSTLTAPAPVLAPGGKYVTGDDNLLITSYASIPNARIVISGRMLNEDGRPVPFRDEQAANSDRTAKTSVVRLATGWLTDVTAIVSGASAQLAQVFVRVDLVRGDGAGAQVLATLIQGALNAAQRLAWPGSMVTSMHAAGGALRSVLGTDPAANVEISETVPTGARWRVRALRFALVTDVNAANREVAITYDDGTTVYAEAAAGANQAASLTRQYTGAITGVRGAAATGSGISIALPDLTLLAGHRIATATTNRQAGDNYGAPQLLVEEWLEGA